ncbi:MAG: Proteasome subunit beta type-7 [Watsoniomyces obsoletus]|nr:MAG: Proteasome subunit beta type-7 [Watsoniomyces obsoletus]
MRTSILLAALASLSFSFPAPLSSNPDIDPKTGMSWSQFMRCALCEEVLDESIRETCWQRCVTELFANITGPTASDLHRRNADMSLELGTTTSAALVADHTAISTSQATASEEPWSLPAASPFPPFSQPEHPSTGVAAIVKRHDKFPSVLPATTTAPEVNTASVNLNDLGPYHHITMPTLAALAKRNEPSTSDDPVAIAKSGTSPEAKNCYDRCGNTLPICYPRCAGVYPKHVWTPEDATTACNNVCSAHAPAKDCELKCASDLETFSEAAFLVFQSTIDGDVTDIELSTTTTTSTSYPTPTTTTTTDTSHPSATETMPSPTTTTTSVSDPGLAGQDPDPTYTGTSTMTIDGMIFAVGLRPKATPHPTSNNAHSSATGTRTSHIPSTSTATLAGMTFTLNVDPVEPMNASATSHSNSSLDAVKGATHTGVGSTTTLPGVTKSTSTSQAHRIVAERPGSLASILFFSLVMAVLVSFVFGML